MIEGAVYSDTAAFRTLLFHTKSGIYYVYGDESKTSIDHQLAYCFQQAIEQQKRFTLFSYSEQWNTKIEQLLNNQLRKLERYTFTFDENIYNHREKHGERYEGTELCADSNIFHPTSS